MITATIKSRLNFPIFILNECLKLYMITLEAAEVLSIKKSSTHQVHVYLLLVTENRQCYSGDSSLFHIVSECCCIIYKQKTNYSTATVAATATVSTTSTTATTLHTLSSIRQTTLPCFVFLYHHKVTYMKISDEH